MGNFAEYPGLKNNNFMRKKGLPSIASQLRIDPRMSPSAGMT